ncbi:hypothetical protein [Pedobacter sp. NJ-S-72]
MNTKHLKGYFAILGILAASYSSYAQTAPKNFIDPANMDLTVRPGDKFLRICKWKLDQKQSCSCQRNTLGKLQ